MKKFQLREKNKQFTTQPNDPYFFQRIDGAAICSKCEALYHAGKWTWKLPESTLLAKAERVTCPACQRIDDDKPAGALTLSGDFLHEHRNEIINLIRTHEKMEKAEHALERILKLTESNDGLVVSTTGVHLANRIGYALKAAYKGHSHYHYSEEQSFLSIRWGRD